MFVQRSYGLRARAVLASCILAFAGLLALPGLAAPVVSLTSPPNNKTYGRPAQVPLAANATPTAGRTITKVDFFRNGSSTPLATVTTAPYVATWNTNTNGTFQITARATETGNVSTTSSARTITIANNTTPTVSLVLPNNGASFTTADSILFQATATDNDGTVTQVQFVRGTANTPIGAPVTAAPYERSATLPAGTHQIKAIATDNSSGARTSSTRTITVTAAPTPPTVSITAPANGAILPPDASTDITANVTIGSGGLSHVEFYYDTVNVIGLASGEPYTVRWTNPPPGSHTITAKAFDGFGVSATSAPISVTVPVPRSPPTVTFSSPVSGSLLAAPATIDIAASASATEPGATLTKVELFDDTTLLATFTSPPYTHTLPGRPAGGYLIKAKATDSFGTTATALAYVVVDGEDSCNAAAPLAAVEAKARLAQFGKLPLTFEANAGQAHPDVRFQARAPGFQLFLTQGESVLALRDPARADGEHAVRMRLVGADPKAAVAGRDPVERKSNYLIGSDRSKWRTHIANFEKVQYTQVYPGIDQVFYARDGQVEYDLHVAAGADPSVIKIALQGAEHVAIDAHGDLVLATPIGPLVQKKPVAYQDIAGERRSVEASYEVLQGGELAFRLGEYDAAHELVIDPVLVYSTYLGGSDSSSGVNGIAVSRCGEAYVTGFTFATTFPTSAGALETTPVPGTRMGFVTKLNPTGTGIIYSTYLTGTLAEFGSQSSEGVSIALDASGHAYATGMTNATDFPVTPGAFQTQPSPGSGFLAKLNSNGSGLIYSTYLQMLQISSVAVDGDGSAHVASGRRLYKLNASGTTLLYEVLLGGSGSTFGQQDAGNVVRLDAAGNAYVAGDTYSSNLPTTPGVFQPTKPNAANSVAGFVTKVDPAGAVAYTTYLGTTGDMYIRGMAVDATGNVYVAGFSNNPQQMPNFTGPYTLFNNNVTHSANRYAYVAKLNAGGASLAYASRIGGSFCQNFSCGSAWTTPTSLALDAAGAAWVFGSTGSNQIPMVRSFPAPPTFQGGAFVAKVSPSGGALQFSTLLNGRTAGTPSPNGPSGDAPQAIAVDAAGSAYVAGYTAMIDFPTTPGAYQTAPPGNAVVAGYVAKINETNDTTLVLAAAPTPGEAGVPTTLTATLTRLYPGEAPTGTVEFKDGTAVLGSAPIAANVAQLQVSFSGGLHNLSATYAGDAHNNAANGSTTHSVSDPNALPTVLLTGVPDGATLVAGANGLYSGGVLNVEATAGAGNRLTQVRIYHQGGYVFWTLSQPSFASSWAMPNYGVGFHTVYAAAFDQLNHVGESRPIRFVVNGASAVAPSVAIATPANGATFTTTDSIALTATASGGSAAISSITYYSGSTPIGSANVSPYTFNWSNVAAGTYSVMALAVDSTGARKLSAPIAITVSSPPPPTVSLVSPANGATFNTPPSITLAAEASAASGATITKVEFFDGSTLLGTATAAPYTYVWNTPPGGTHSLTAKATDSRNATATSATATIQISSPPPPTVSIASPAPGASFEAPASIPIGVNATAGTGANITSIEIYAGTQLIGLGNVFTWNILQPGTYVLTAKAFDDRGSSATSAPVSVTITPAPEETITFLHTDLLGSPIAATNASGAEIWTERFQPYGERVLKESAAAGNRQWFTGKPHDADTGLSYFGARYYDPIVARFMGVDPVGFTPDNLHSFNRYAYAANNPYRYVDPDGREIIDADGGRKKYSKGVGHHWVPFGSLSPKDQPLDVSSEARAYFGKQSSGQKIPAEIHNKGHHLYNEAVTKELLKFAKDNHIDLSKMTAVEADRFVLHVKSSTNPDIMNLRERVEKFNSLPEASRRGYRFLSTIGLGLAVEMSMPSPTRAVQCQAGMDYAGC